MRQAQKPGQTGVTPPRHKERPNAKRSAGANSCPRTEPKSIFPAEKRERPNAAQGAQAGTQRQTPPPGQTRAPLEEASSPAKRENPAKPTNPAQNGGRPVGDPGTKEAQPQGKKQALRGQPRLCWGFDRTRSPKSLVAGATSPPTSQHGAPTRASTPRDMQGKQTSTPLPLGFLAREHHWESMFALHPPRGAETPRAHAPGRLISRVPWKGSSL